MTRRNIGVAIGIPEPLGAQLQQWREELGDPNARDIIPHVTLLPPTLVRTERLPVIEEHLRLVASRESPFAIHLRGSGTFRPVSPVVFVPLVAGISNCERLERHVRSGPLLREIRFPYHPHVTMAHDLPEAALDRAFAELAGFEGRFTVGAFTLFEQMTDRSWSAQRDFPLGGDAPPNDERSDERDW